MRLDAQMLTHYDQKTSAHHEDPEGHEGSEFESLFFVLPLKVFAARANFPVVIQAISVQKRIHRGDAEYAEKRIL
jgi:hypothetical protein